MTTSNRRGAGYVAGPPLVRYLARCRVAPREAARQLVRAGRVRVNGEVCTEGARRIDSDRDRVEVDGRSVSLPDVAKDVAIWAVNKPRGVVATTRDPEGRPTVMDLVPLPHAPGLSPMGRLDKASAGLLLVGNDPLLAAHLLDPTSHVVKLYRVKVRGRPSEATLAAWRTDTLQIEGLSLGPMDVEVESIGPRSIWLRIRLAEGKNRQIRRRVEAAGHEVEILVRLAFGPIELGDLQAGQARLLSDDEVAALRVCAGQSRE